MAALPSPTLSIKATWDLKKKKKTNSPARIGGADRACDFPEDRIGMRMGLVGASDLPHPTSLAVPKSFWGPR